MCTAVKYSTGRGGAGNMAGIPGADVLGDKLVEEEEDLARAKYHQDHSAELHVFTP